ncbi:hypothetical protein EDB19DRAFT_1911960 [Suillus lakei]|nr:hypothetical protein EDB19DRAFT_1911960 [Suillus lakei]
MTCVINNTSPALDAIIKLLSVLNLTDNDCTVLATKLLSDIAEPRGGACAANAIDLQISSSLSIDAELADAKSMLSQDQVNGDSEGTNAEISTSESPLKNDANTGIPNGPQKRQQYISPTSRIESHLITFLGGPDVVIYDYLDTVSLTLLGRTDNTINTKDICTSISKLQRLEKDACKEEAGILQFYGVGPKLVQAEVMSKKVHHLLSTFHSLSSVDELVVMYDQADLLFQSW